MKRIKWYVFVPSVKFFSFGWYKKMEGKWVGAENYVQKVGKEDKRE